MCAGLNVSQWSTLPCLPARAARVDLDGYSTDFDLIQQGSTAQSYNLDNTCSNALGCTINTTQGTQ